MVTVCDGYMDEAAYVNVNMFVWTALAQRWDYDSRFSIKCEEWL